MMPSEAYTYLSSRLVKEVFALGGPVDGFVPTEVERRLAQKRLAASPDPPGTRRV
jgi:pantetheine-phosphate adenylyltransferase